jgi:hypothetical protein
MDSYHEIKALILTYALCIDNGDFEGIGKLFTRGKIIGNEDNEASHIVGSEAICAMYTVSTRRYADGTPCTHHVTTNIAIDVDDRTARATSYFTVFQAVKDFPLQPIIAGRYHDTFALHTDTWWFETRRMEITLVGDVSHHLLIDLDGIQSNKS